jgi:hypothetical protein
MHVSKEGNPYLRSLLAGGAHHLLDLWGSRQRPAPMGNELAEHWGERGKTRTHSQSR